MTLLFNYKVLIGLFCCLCLYVVVRDVLRARRLKANEREALKQLNASQKRSSQLFEEMEKNRDMLHSNLKNLMDIASDLQKQQSSNDAQNNPPKTADSSPRDEH